jgi:sugar/nucleoside kinase (ribokinase family)
MVEEAEAGPGHVAGNCLPVLCIGAAHWDLIGRAGRAPRRGDDLPGTIARRPGGVALNIALGLAAAGAPVTLLAVVGRDAAGAALIAIAEAAGIDCAHVLRLAGPTDGYLAIEDPDGALFAAVADCGRLEATGEAVLAPLLDGPLAAAATPWRGRMVLDGNLPEAVAARLVTDPATAHAARLHVPASPAKAARLASVIAVRRTGSDAAILNRAEAEALARRSFAGAAEAATALVGLGLTQVLVTDGTGTLAHAGPEGLVTARPRLVAARSLTGAGDRLAAAHLAAQDAGLDAAAALEAAVEAVARHLETEAIREVP